VSYTPDMGLRLLQMRRLARQRREDQTIASLRGELEEAREANERLRTALAAIATNPFTWQADIAAGALSPNPEAEQGCPHPLDHATHAPYCGHPEGEQ
jgi:hypothetical protein